MNIYPDHNFLIYCVKRQWREAVLNAHRSGRITVVMSSWHFYEYGNASAYDDTEELIRFAEDLEPMWIIERGDLQLHEFIAVWNSIWDGAPTTFDPICTLAEAGAKLNRVPVERMARYTIRDYVGAFSGVGALDEIQAVMNAQTGVAKSNLGRYVADKEFDRVLALTEIKHVACQLARIDEIIPNNVYRLAEELLQQQPISTQIQCFVYWCCTELLKAYKTEVAFTLDLYANKGTLDEHRQVDRQHAIPALSYCDVLVTDDKKLIRLCERVKPTLKFKTASVMTAEAFVNTL